MKRIAVTRPVTFFLGSLFLFALVSVASAEKFRSHDAAATQRLLANGGKLVADYGTFQVVEAGAASAATETNQVESAVAEYFIELHTGAVDTRTAAMKSLRKVRGNFRGKGLHLV